MNLKDIDIEIYEEIEKERQRQSDNLELIASENIVSKAILEAQGSILTNKYAEGYPGSRYYGGCEFVDQIEDLARNRAKELFGAKFANVQAHSGSQANMGAYRALLKPNDVVLGMALDHGGHLTHGHPLNFSGQDYKFVPYFVDKQTQLIDYEQVQKVAQEVRPNLIVAGASNYSRIIDFAKIKEIADDVGAKFMVDMAHIAGLVAAGLHPNPVLYADVVTSTTHKTLRGPRGGLILTNDEEISKQLNRVVFPGIQGGPLMHVIAAKAVAFKEAASLEFQAYQVQVVKNAQAMANAFMELGYRVVSNGTDNHLFTINVKESVGLTGKKAEKILDSVRITTNKNTVPFDEEKPFITSGIRIGTPSITTRGMKESEAVLIAQLMDQALKNYKNEEKLLKVREEVKQLTQRFPIHK